MTVLGQHRSLEASGSDHGHTRIEAFESIGDQRLHRASMTLFAGKVTGGIAH